MPLAALAQSETPYDLVAAVNALRALHALEPYAVDAGLMAYAQEHSEYQAATGTSTHVHRDGARPWSIGLQENVAAGDVGVVTVAVVVYQIWSDWGHRHILVGYATGDIGAGIACTEDGVAYYTVDIRPGEELAATIAPFIPLAKSTPAEDGSVAHVVAQGQTLWDIALSYGVTVDDIRRLNNMAADSTVIGLGQKLLILPADADSAILEDATPSMIAESPSVTRAPPTPTMPSTAQTVSSPSPAALPAGLPSGESHNRVPIGWAAALVVGIIGLSIAAFFGFRQARDERMMDADAEGGRATEHPPREP
jgi:LysM repeat protein